LSLTLYISFFAFYRALFLFFSHQDSTKIAKSADTSPPVTVVSVSIVHIPVDVVTLVVSITTVP
jgi:hypothetical protein